MSISALFDRMEYGPAPESSQQANKWLDSHNHTFSLFVGGNWVRPSSKNKIKIHNPATGSLLASVADANKKDVNKAVEVAKKAFPSWSGLSGHQRARYLYAIARSIQKHSRLFSVLESMDNGKPIRESRDIDIPLVARHFYYYAGWAQLQEQELGDYEPIGVAGQIIPVELPVTHDGLEGGTSHSNGQHRST